MVIKFAPASDFNIEVGKYSEKQLAVEIPKVSVNAPPQKYIPFSESSFLLNFSILGQISEIQNLFQWFLNLDGPPVPPLYFL